MKIFHIAVYEWRYLLKSPQTPVTFVIFLALGSIALFYLNGEGASDIFSLGRNVNINSPFYITVSMMALSMLGLLVAPSFLAESILKDREHNFTEILFSKPVSKMEYLFGRFLGAFAALILAMTAIPASLLVSTFWLPLAPESLGPTNLGHYLFAFFVFMMPAMLALSAMIFAVAVISRNIIYTYLTIIGLVIVGLTGIALSGIMGILNPNFLALTDPSLLVIFNWGIAHQWTPEELNTVLFKFDGLGIGILANRLICLIAAGFLFGLAYLRFSFKTRAKKARRIGPPHKPSRTEYCSVTDMNRHRDAGKTARALGKVPSVFSRGTALRQLISRTWFEIKATVLNLPFILLMCIGLVYLIESLSSATFLSYPVTTVMVTALTGGPVTLLLILIIIFFGPEIFWRERKYKFHEIIDSLPAPNWVFVTSKCVALALILCVITLSGIAISIIYQLNNSRVAIRPGLYFEQAFLYFLLPVLFMAVLGSLSQVLAKNRFSGMVILPLYLLITYGLYVIGFDHPLYQNPIAGDVPVPLSDMNGTGRFIEGGYWLRAYWTALAIPILMLSYVLWNRGTFQPLRYRLRKLRSFKKACFFIPAVIAVFFILGLGAFIFYNTNIINNHVSMDEINSYLAEHEKRYGQFENLPMPRIIDISMDVDIYPYRKRIETRSRQILKNKTDVEIRTVHLEFPPSAEVVSVDLEGGNLRSRDDEAGYYIFDLNAPMLPGERHSLNFETLVQIRGFNTSNPDISVVRNGTYFENSKVTPHIGYDHSKSILDPKMRQKYALPPFNGLAGLKDTSNPDIRNKSMLREDSDLVNFEATVSTVEGQTAVTSGSLTAQWSHNGRSYFTYRTDTPIYYCVPFFSAEYELLRDRWKDVSIEIYYHPGHTFNLDTMLESLKDGLAYYSNAFGPYRYKQLRVMEYPLYRTNSRSLPTVIAHSEANGFLERDPGESYGTMAHELSHHWWGHQLNSARAEGATVMAETFASYSARLLLENQYGQDYFLHRRFVSPITRYLRGRNGDPIGEVPLYRATSQVYLSYYKGEVIMDALKDYLGEAVMNRSLSRLLETYGNRSGPYPLTTDFMSILKDEAGPEYRCLIEDFFEKVTLYDLRLERARLQRLEDGRYKITLDVETAKYYPDIEGKEIESHFDIPVDIGLFLKSPKDRRFRSETDVVYLTKHTLSTRASSIEIIVYEKPTFAGIDPYNKLIERNSNDNIHEIATSGVQ